MADSIGSGTAKGLIEYLNTLISKGRARAGIVVPLRTALLKVLEKTEQKNWESIDILKFDVADAMVRFKNFTNGTYTSESYRAYESRVKRAITWYKNFLDNPGWYPQEKSRSSKANSENRTTDKKTRSVKMIAATKINAGSYHENPSPINTENDLKKEVSIIETTAYPFPLANGKMARLYIPKGVTKADVKRLSAFLDALVIETIGE